jgi:hypothetical protein
MKHLYVFGMNMINIKVVTFSFSPIYEFFTIFYKAHCNSWPWNSESTKECGATLWQNEIAREWMDSFTISNTFKKSTRGIRIQKKRARRDTF